MGPRPIRRGNFKADADLYERYMLQWGHVQSDVETSTILRDSSMLACFNGATSNQTWKRWTLMENERRTVCFNGATSNQTWKRVRDMTIY